MYRRCKLQAGDMMLDLKSGYLVGASPRKQQIAQLLATWLGPILVVGLIYVLHDAYTLGSKRLPAPQATALAGVIEGI
ncbi:MAG TPA: oligopeptide transporter OPT family protein, partial [Nitratifractor sp.]|nr:oligopeptide transporter OPT family protein [Nitratifractor sp.]